VNSVPLWEKKRVSHEDTKTTKKKIKLFVNFVPLWEKVAHQATKKTKKKYLKKVKTICALYVFPENKK
jgi:hypothetical protein